MIAFARPEEPSGSYFERMAKIRQKLCYAQPLSFGEAQWLYIELVKTKGELACLALKASGVGGAAKEILDHIADV